jgi:glycerol-1-phosphatase
MLRRGRDGWQRAVEGGGQAMTAVSNALPAGLASSDGSLLDGHDLLLVDLDGVVYLGDQPIDGAAEAFSAARKANVRLIFVTNNASRSPTAVAEQLVSMDVAARPSEVMTSAIAAARELAGRYQAGSAVLVVGGEGVRDALIAAGLRPVTSADDNPVAVLQGFAPEVAWPALAEASVALHAGAVWIATNDDATLPSPRGPLPGNGSFVAALATATGLTPEVIGKPAPALFKAALRAGSGTRPLVIGDRLDTDIAGARAATLPSLLVLTGVSSASDLIAAPADSRPNYIGRDLGALTLVHPEVDVRGGVATCGGASASMVAGIAQLAKTSTETATAATPDGLDGLRALCALAWSGASATAEMYTAALSELDLG